MKETQEKLEEEKASEVELDEMREIARCRVASNNNYEKAPALSMEDINQECSIKRTFKHKSRYEEQKDGVYFSALLVLKSGVERWKTLNSWDMEAIASNATAFKVGTVKYKGGYKLVLVPLGQAAKGGNPPFI